MRPFRVGDEFKGNHSGTVAEVIWVDPQDRFKAVVNTSELIEQTVFASQFLNHWTLIKEGSAA
jgi:hypothetical protein